MRILMNFIHYRSDCVSHDLTLPRLLQFPESVNKYKCITVVKFVAEAWFINIEKSNVESTFPLSTLVVLVTSACFLEDPAAFRRYTSTLLKDHVWDVKTSLGFFIEQMIPRDVLVEIVHALDKQRSGVYQVLEVNMDILRNKTMLHVTTRSASGSIVRRDAAGLASEIIATFPKTSIAQLLCDLSCNANSAVAPELAALNATVKSAARGICLRCLCEGEKFPEDCTEHE